MPLYTTDALILRTYRLGESDRIVVFLTRDRGKKRGVAKNARQSRRRFGGALEPLTYGRVGYFERERRELVTPEFRRAGPVAAVGARRRGARLRRVLRRADRRVGAGSGPERDAVPAGRVDGRCDGRRGADRAAGAGISSSGCCGCRVCTRPMRGCPARRGDFLTAARAVSPFALGRRGGDRGDASRARGGAPRADCHAPGEGSQVGARAEGDAAVKGRLKTCATRRCSAGLESCMTMTFQSLILKLSEFWASRGCTLQQPLDIEVGAGTMHPETFLRVLGSGALERGVRAAVPPARRRTLRREPEPALQAPPVSGDPQAVARRGAAALSRKPRSVRHQPAPARHPLRRGQLGVADARRVGHRVADSFRRPRDHAVHVFSAGGRPRAGADFGRAHLRARAHRDGAAAGRQRVRPRVVARA